MAAKGIRLLEHPPYLLDLFRRAKEALAGIMLDQESLKNAWVGVARNITADIYATAFQWWFERVKKCVRARRSSREVFESKGCPLFYRCLFIITVSFVWQNTKYILQYRIS
jgi:hypothetical protein